MAKNNFEGKRSVMGHSCIRASQPRFAFPVCHSEFGLVVFPTRKGQRQLKTSAY